MNLKVPHMSRTLYHKVPDEESVIDQPPAHEKYSKRSIWLSLITVILAAIATCGYRHWALANTDRHSHTLCGRPATRREWRTLTDLEKDHYLASVQCLRTRPSRLDLNHTLYDDFPWIHSRIGAYVHDAAPFVAWHRYFVHVYEKALKDDCGFHGMMPFWDWQLDWQDVTKAPIWSAEHGFGTNGHADPSSHTIVKGHCVRDGPFKDFVIPYLDERNYPHCLSRGFLEGEQLYNKSMMLKPEVLEALMAMDSYEDFNLGLEHGPHLAIPQSIRGDFSLLTAPSDPVFFLHHAQLDRLWWRWQSVGTDRATRFSGVASHGSQEQASLEDLLRMGGLAPDIPVSRIMETQGSLLCYRY